MATRKTPLFDSSPTATVGPQRSKFRTRSVFSSLGTLALLASLGLSGSGIGSPAMAEDETTPRLDAPLEYLDDAPGTPALADPNALPAEPHVYRGFSSVQVNTSGGANIPGDAANEPSIAVDPTNPLRMAIGWRQFDTVNSNFRQAGFAYSVDGGRSWTFPGVLTPGVFRSDPVLGFAADGTLYYNSLTNDFTTDVFKSDDAGETYPTSADADGGDKQWMAIDRSGGPGNGNIYQAWSDAAGCCGPRTFNLSSDEGENFTNPVQLDGRPRWGTMAVGPNGTLYMVGTTDGGNSDYWLIRSTDAQTGTANPSFDYFSIDLGGSMALFADPNPQGLAGQIYVGIDPSNGPNGGNLYVVCSIDPPGSDPLDVHFVKSTDDGETWSSPVAINTDPSGNYNWFGTMSVSPDGRVDVVWLDTRVSNNSHDCALFLSQSTDGGSTWSSNTQMSGEFDSWDGWPQQNKLGDYYEMESDLVGADLAWAATLNGEQDVYYLRIGDRDCNQNGIGDATDIADGTSTDVDENGIPDDCEDNAAALDPLIPNTGSYLLGNVPNPLHESTTIRFAVPVDAGKIRMAVFDVDGRLVRTLVDGEIPAGVSAVTWDGNDDSGRPVASGVFFYKLETDRISETRSLQVVR